VDVDGSGEETTIGETVVIKEADGAALWKSAGDMLG
jgi:hypothetical protein